MVGSHAGGAKPLASIPTVQRTSSAHTSNSAERWPQPKVEEDVDTKPPSLKPPMA